MAKPYDLSKPLVAFAHESTLVCVIEMSGSSWLAAATVPGVDRRPLQKLPVSPPRLLEQLARWRAEAVRAGRTVQRTVVAFESGRDGFWLARLLRRHGIEVYVIHASSVAVSREQRRAKTDRLDTEMLMRALLGWLRGEPGHCRMVAIPTIAQEDARRPGREREGLVAERTRLTNTIKAELAVWGIQGFKSGLKTAADHLAALRTMEGDPLPPNTQAKLRRLLERRRLVSAQIAALERAAAQAVAQDPTMIQLAWRFLMFQPDCALVRWYRERTAGGKGGVKKTMIVALARKLLIALWRYVTEGVVPDGLVLKTA